MEDTELLTRFIGVILGWLTTYGIIYMVDKSTPQKKQLLPFVKYVLPITLLSTCLEYYTGIYFVFYVVILSVIFLFGMKIYYERK